MGPGAALLALAADAGLHLAVDGSCPGAAQVREAIDRSLDRTGAKWPEGRTLSLRLHESDAEMALELLAADGEVVLQRSFRDEAGDCAARAETVGLVVARYLESLGEPGEPPRVRTRVEKPAPRSRRALLGVDLGIVAAGGVADPSGNTAVDLGPQLGARAGVGNLAGALRVGWLFGDSFREASTSGRARVDRLPVTLAGLLLARRGRLTLGAGPRLVLEAVRSSGQSEGLRTDTSLAVKAGGEGEVTVALLAPWVVGLGAGVDIALRRIEIRVTDLDSSEPVALAGQDLAVPWVQLFAGARWNLGR